MEDDRPEGGTVDLSTFDEFAGPIVATAAAFLLGWILRGLRAERQARR
jgi:hypothetical protein